MESYIKPQLKTVFLTKKYLSFQINVTILGDAITAVPQFKK